MVAEPEIEFLELTQEFPFAVVASDGIFEFMTSQKVVEMVRARFPAIRSCFCKTQWLLQ